MGILDTLRDMVVPDTEQGVKYECTDCGTRFETARGTCPNCGSTETKEVEGFEFRPSS